MADTEALADALIAATEKGERQFRAYSSDRICALRGGATADEISAWHLAWPWRPPEEFQRPLVAAVLAANSQSGSNLEPAGSSVDTITIPRPHVPYGPTHVSPEEADADYLRSAVRNIEHLDHGKRLWGSNLTATIIRLLNDSADAIEAKKEAPRG